MVDRGPQVPEGGVLGKGKALRRKLIGNLNTSRGVTVPEPADPTEKKRGANRCLHVGSLYRLCILF